MTDDPRLRGAEYLDSEIAQLEQRLTALRAEVAVAEAQLATFREAAALLRSERPLPDGKQRRTVDAMMAAEQRRAISRSRTDRDDEFTRALYARGHTLRSLARLVGASPTHLSLARAGKKRLSPELQARVEKVVGKRWPY